MTSHCTFPIVTVVLPTKPSPDICNVSPPTALTGVTPDTTGVKESA